MRTYTVQDFGPNDLLSSDVIGLRRVKTSADTADVGASLNGTLFVISATYSVFDGETLAFNLSPAADLIVRSVTTNKDLSILAYNEHATGTADGIFTASDVNMTSSDISPTQGQLFYTATPSGNVIAAGHTSISPAIVAGYNEKPCFTALNSTGETTDIRITVVFEEIGEREPVFGLTPTTFLQTTTEMSDYG